MPDQPTSTISITCTTGCSALSTHYVTIISRSTIKILVLLSSSEIQTIWHEGTVTVWSIILPSIALLTERQFERTAGSLIKVEGVEHRIHNLFARFHPFFLLTLFIFFFLKYLFLLLPFCRYLLYFLSPFHHLFPFLLFIILSFINCFLLYLFILSLFLPLSCYFCVSPFILSRVGGTHD